MKRAQLISNALCCLLIACGANDTPADGGSAGGATAGGAASGGGAGGGSAGGATAGGAAGGASAGGSAGGATAGGSAGGSAGGTVGTEVEPNSGAPDGGQLDSITAPGAKQGAVGTANDIDIFTVMLTAGTRWTWSLASNGSVLAPHLAVSEFANTVPALVSRGAAGGTASIEQLVLKTGTYAVIVRDSRNVPASTTQNAGSAAHTYTVSGAASVRAPMPVAVPSTTPGTLANRYASALYAFALTSSTAVTVNVRAKAKATPSDMDSRLTLFAKSTNQWVGTNDDLSGASTDSKLSGTLTPGDYWVVVDNVSETSNDLSFELVITSP